MAEFIAAICVGAGACDSLISICPFFDVLTDVYFYYKYKGYMKQVMLPMNKDEYRLHPNGMTDERPKSDIIYNLEVAYVQDGLMKEEDLGVLACSCIAAIPEDDWEACCLRQLPDQASYASLTTTTTFAVYDSSQTSSFDHTDGSREFLTTWAVIGSCPTKAPFEYPCRPDLGIWQTWYTIDNVLYVTIVAGFMSDIVSGVLLLSSKKVDALQFFGAFKGIVAIAVIVFEDVLQLVLTLYTENTLLPDSLRQLELCGYETVAADGLSLASQVNVIGTLGGMAVKAYKANQLWKDQKEGIPLIGGALENANWFWKLVAAGTCLVAIPSAMLMLLVWANAEFFDDRNSDPDSCEDGPDCDRSMRRPGSRGRRAEGPECFDLNPCSQAAFSTADCPSYSCDWADCDNDYSTQCGPLYNWDCKERCEEDAEGNMKVLNVVRGICFVATIVACGLYCVSMHRFKEENFSG